MDSKDLSWLAAKQKRLKSWTAFSNEETQDQEIKSKTDTSLKLFSEKLLAIWESGEFNQQDVAEIENLERKLEQLNEESRVRAVGKELQ